MLIDTCVNSFYKTVFPSSESFNVDPLTLHCRILQIIKRTWTILEDNRFEMSLKEIVKGRQMWLSGWPFHETSSPNPPFGKGLVQVVTPANCKV